MQMRTADFAAAAFDTVAYMMTASVAFVVVHPVSVVVAVAAAAVVAAVVAAVGY